MLTLKMLRDDPKAVIEKLKIKNFDAQPIVDKVLELDARRRSLQTESDALLARQKQKAAEIGGLMKQGQRDAAEAAKAEVAALKARSAELLAQMDEAAAELEAQLVLMPNTPCALVKPGKGAEDNEVVKMGGPEVNLPEGALPHWELAKKYDIIDFDLGVKITGAGFPVYKGKGAKLQRALINFFLDCNTADGYKEVEPPVMVNAASGFGTGQLPDKEGQMYHATVDDFYMVPTAEVPVTNIFRDVILQNDELPQALTAYTPCFRREAGSYGKDVRGLNRLHQFDKVEIVRVEKPQDSYAALDRMVAHVESIVNKLPSRPTACTSATGTRTARSSSPTRSTAVPSRFRAWSPRCWRTTRPPKASSSPRSFARTQASIGLTDSRTILGIDPGTNLLGFGIVRVDGKGRPSFVDMGVLDLRKEKDSYIKLRRIFEKVGALCDLHHPDDLAVESPFYGHNAQVILKLGRAQGAAMMAALSRGIPVFEYAPRKAKMAICGNGAASKEQVSLIVQRTLGIDIEEKWLDATDALAIAMCHFYQLTSPLTSTKAATSWEKFLEANPGRVKK